MSMLASILDHTREELNHRRLQVPVRKLMDAPSYARPIISLEGSLRRPGLRVIAELKKASPSKGILRGEFDPVAIALGYAAAGAAGISVLTEEKHFQGSLEYLRAVRAAVALPLLRKDFIIDEYQIHEARAAGADAILLIVAALGANRLEPLLNEAASAGLECLVEVHSEADIRAANDAGATMIGLNNRNLATFATELGVSLRLSPLARPEAVLVSESGIGTGEDIARLRDAGIHCVLVGETFMRAGDPGAALKEFLGSGGARR